MKKNILFYSFLLLILACTKPEMNINHPDGDVILNFDDIYEIAQNSIFEKEIPVDEKKTLESQVSECLAILNDNITDLEPEKDIIILWYENQNLLNKFKKIIETKFSTKKIISLPYEMVRKELSKTNSRLGSLKEKNKEVKNTVIDYIILNELIPSSINYYELLNSYYISLFQNSDKALEGKLMRLYEPYYISDYAYYPRKLNKLVAKYSNNFVNHFISSYLFLHLHPNSKQTLDAYIEANVFYPEYDSDIFLNDTESLHKLKLKAIIAYAEQLAQSTASISLELILKHFVHIEQICHLFDQEDDLIKFQELIKKDAPIELREDDNLEYAKQQVHKKLRTLIFDQKSFFNQLERIHRPTKFNDAIQNKINDYKEFWKITKAFPLEYAILDNYLLGPGYCPISKLHYLYTYSPNHKIFMLTFSHEMGHVIQAYYREIKRLKDFSPKKHKNSIHCKELEADFLGAYYLAHPKAVNSSKNALLEYSNFFKTQICDNDPEHGDTLQRQRAFNFGANLAKMDFFNPNETINIIHLHYLFRKYLKATDSFLNIEHSEKELFTSPNSEIQDISKKEKLNITFQKIKTKFGR